MQEWEKSLTPTVEGSKSPILSRHNSALGKQVAPADPAEIPEEEDQKRRSIQDDLILMSR